MEQPLPHSTGETKIANSLPHQSFRRLLADALMASSLYPALLLAACFMEEDAGFGPVPFVIIGFYLLAALTMAFAAWRMLRGEGALSLRKRCFFVLRSSLLLSAPYLVIYFVAGGSYLPWWVAPVFVLFMMPIPVFFLERQRWRRQIAAERTMPVSRPALPRALRGNLFICVLLSLAPAAGMLHVVELVNAAHGGGAGVEEIAFRCGAPVLACLVLTVLIYLLLKLLRCVVKRFPYLRRLEPLGATGLLCFMWLLLPDDVALRAVVGIVLWWLLLRHLIRLSTGSCRGWYWWRDSRPACILQSIIPSVALVCMCAGDKVDSPFYSLIVLYLLSFCAQGYRGESSPVRRVVFIFLASHTLACSFMCMCTRGFMLSSYALGLAPTAILFLYLLENRSTEQKTEPS